MKRDRQSILFRDIGLAQMRSRLEDFYHSLGGGLFMPNSIYEVFELQESLNYTKEKLKFQYEHLEETPDYADCMDYLSLLEITACLRNPGGGMN